MNARLNSFSRLLVRLYALALRLYPQQVRGEYTSEMQAVFGLRVADAAHLGAWRLFRLAGREARDLPQAITAAYFEANRGRMDAYFPATSDRTPWLAALLSLLPISIAGPLRLAVSYLPGWSPRESSLLYLAFLLSSTLVVAGGLLVGALRKFPRWAYPYPIYLSFSIYTLVLYAIYLFQLNVNGQPSFIFSLAAILALLALPGLRAFYEHIPRDWTRLSYGLYGLVLYLLATTDFDEQPVLNLLVLLPSTLSLCAALTHLRIRSAPLRILALLAGTYAGLGFLLLPIFTGMVSILAGALIGLVVLAIYAAVLTAILLAPMLVSGALRLLRNSQTSG